MTWLVLLLACGESDKATVVDADGDGFDVAQDCNDADGTINPDAEEICDGVDNDCDGVADDRADTVTVYADEDGDGFGDPNGQSIRCSADGLPTVAGDCDDTDAEVHPEAHELCNGVDDDCSGLIDDGVGSEWFVDADADGFGNADVVLVACDPPTGFVADSDDCDDSTDASNPDASEVCDGEDNDCDGQIDEGATGTLTFYADVDQDGYGDPFAPVTACEQPAGTVTDSSDCNDQSDAVSPADAEICGDGVDNDCSGSADGPDAVDALTFYLDADDDGHGVDDLTLQACEAPANFAATDDDCDDLDPTAYPGADELCDGVDNDCLGDVDEADAIDVVPWYADTDSDGFGDPGSTPVLACDPPTDTVDNTDDCDDSTDTITTATTWYPDGDDDGFGDPAGTPIVACSAPSDHVDDASDCNDGDDTIGGQRDWFVDNDGDGFGDPSTPPTPSCTPLSGAVTNNADCDDATDTVGGPVSWFPDADDDGFGDPFTTPVVACSGPPDTVANADDCDDGTDTITTPATWYTDGDDDGHGDPLSPVVACTQPSGTAATPTDCDDGLDTISPDDPEICDGIDNDCDGTSDVGATDEQTWYLDWDGDTFGDDARVTVACFAPTVDHVLIGGDCNDGDVTFFPSAPLACDGTDRDCDTFMDNDGDLDGYPDATCGGDDCNDGDANFKPEQGFGCAVSDSCLGIQLAGRDNGDGTYLIDVDGWMNGISPFDVACDFSTNGGGWTLIATNDWASAWTVNETLDDTEFGTLSFGTSFKSIAWAEVPFSDLLFETDSEYAVYNAVHDGSSPYWDWQDSIPLSNCAFTDGYEWPMSEGDLAGSNLCNTNLYVHPLDKDGSAGNCSSDGDARGPTWSVGNNGGCPLDDPNQTDWADPGTGSRLPWGTGTSLRMWVR